MRKLPREPGKRESRFVQLFSTDASLAELSDTEVHREENSASFSQERQTLASSSTPSGLADALTRIGQLEHQVKSLSEQVQLLTEIIEN